MQRWIHLLRPSPRLPEEIRKREATKRHLRAIPGGTTSVVYLEDPRGR